MPKAKVFSIHGCNVGLNVSNTDVQINGKGIEELIREKFRNPENAEKYVTDKCVVAIDIVIREIPPVMEVNCDEVDVEYGGEVIGVNGLVEGCDGCDDCHITTCENSPVYKDADNGEG